MAPAKKKWSKNKTREKLANLVYCDDATFQKLMSDVPKFRLITVSVVSERMRVNGTLARAALKELCEKGLIKKVSTNQGQHIYTRAIADGEEPVFKAAKPAAAAEEESFDEDDFE
eukprot:a339583_8871.p2 GENE.a339583_8871~~a339583_8871.p2  ORF type:complete len:126 (-),score=51.14 a339583_8871:14-358(-)